MESGMTQHLDLSLVYDRECPNCHASLPKGDWVECAACGFTFERHVSIYGGDEWIVSYDATGKQLES